jgi:hypothetical protein
MKKFGLFFCFLNLGIFCFSQNQEGWASFGVSWGNQWEKAGDPIINTYMGSFGIDLKSYSFNDNKNIGTYASTSFLFPMTSTVTANGVGGSVDLLSAYDFIFELTSIYGVGFRKILSDNNLLKFSVGPEFGLQFATSKHTRLLAFILGIGGDLGIKFGINDLISISVGSAVSWDFLSYMNGSNVILGDMSGLAKNYSLFNLRPYICMSFNRYRNDGGKMNWGKQ